MKYSRTFRLLALALTLALLAATLPATPALAQYLELTPRQRKIGERVDFYANYLNSTAQVSLYFSDTAADVGKRIDTDVLNYTKVVTGAYTNPGGELSGASASFLVPDKLADGAAQKTVRPGTYYVYLTYYGLKPIVAFASLTVESPGVITVDTTNGTVGTKVKISGQGFASQENIKVAFDGGSVAIQSGADRTSSNGTFTCEIVIPESTTGTHTITVIGDNSGIDARAQFTTKPKVAITPESGTAGDTVTVSGTGWGNQVNFNVFFGDDKVVADKVTSQKGSLAVTFVVPVKTPGRYVVRVEDKDGNTDNVSFTYASAISLSLASGYSGSKVTISGRGFKASKSVTITFDNEDRASAASDETGKFTATFTVPVRTPGTYVVKASDGAITAQADFNISSGATIIPATTAAAPGNVGMGVTINGVGFMAGRTVTVTYDGNQVVTVMVNANGTFSANFNAPASLKGSHAIIATDGTNTQPFTFVMEATPPAPPLPLKPEMAIKAKAEVYFDWEDVSDPSGVTYTLQIATENFTSEGFSPDSMVFEKTRITTSEYALTKEERLKSASKEAPYYWRVQAVDAASNAGGWSGTGAFYVSGFTFGLSQWLRYTLFGIGALLLFIFAFWLGRRTAYY